MFILTKTEIGALIIKPGSSSTPVGCLTSRPLRQLNVSIVLKLFNYLNVTHGIINRAELADTIYQQLLFFYISHACIIFTGIVITA